MSAEVLIQFVLITAAVSISPGPVMLLCLALGSRLSLARVTAAMLGASLGNCVLMALSALGLGALVTLWPRVFSLVAIFGAVYLFYLGVLLWRAPWVDFSSAPQPQLNSYRALLWRGFTVAVSNPKGIVYFGALIPPFLHHAQSYVFSALLLTIIFLCIDLAVMVVYAALGGQLTQFLKDPKAQQRCNQFLASLLMLMAVWLLVDTLLNMA